MTEAGLTDEDVDRALAGTIARGDSMLAKRRRRNAFVSGLGVAVLLVGGFGMLRSLADDDQVVVGNDGSGGSVESTAPAPTGLAPATSTTKGSSVPTTIRMIASGGLLRSESGGVVVLTNPEPPESPPTSTGSNGAVIGGGSSQERSAAVGGRLVGPDVVRVEIECIRTNDHLDELRYQLAGDRLTVQATVTSFGAECAGGPGIAVDLTIPGVPLPADLQVTSGILG
jgi:hypothetical protein